jgi:hypothetical protein
MLADIVYKRGIGMCLLHEVKTSVLSRIAGYIAYIKVGDIQRGTAILA